MQVTFARLAAPSFKSLALAGQGRPVRGQVPSARVIVATDNAGHQWVHERIFRADEVGKAMAVVRKVEAAGRINPTHWRKTTKEY